jgi:hypothetical protein
VVGRGESVVVLPAGGNVVSATDAPDRPTAPAVRDGVAEDPETE